MTTPLDATRLYTQPGGVAVAAHMAFALAGIEVEVTVVPPGQTRSAWFLGLNPLGTVPVLILADGRRLHDAVAILVHAGLHGNHAPGCEEEEDIEAALVEPLSFLSSRVETAFLPLRRPQLFHSSPADAAELAALARHRIERLFGLVECYVGGRPSLRSDPGPVACYLHLLAGRLFEAQLDLAAFPALAQLHRHLERHPILRPILDHYGSS